MPEAEKKDVAKLDFNIGDALTSLTLVDNKLKSIAESSSKYAETIGNNLKKGLDSSKLINVSDVNKNLNLVANLSESGAKKLGATIMTEETKTAANRQRNLDNYQTAAKKANLEVITSEAKKADKIEVIAAETEAYKERKAYASALKQEEYNNRVLKSTKNLYDQISQYAKTFIIYQGFNKLKQAITETIDEMVKVQYEMVQIDRVLNESSLNINKYRDELLKLAYDYGNSFDSVSDATLRLAQAGFDSQESLALTEKTLLALNTAELNATEATDDMVAIMAQWGLMTGTATEQAEKYGEIIDKINKVADNYPTTSADILDALKKMSSGFNLAGASIDETIALFVAAEKASQRGGKAIGTALSNITQQLKDEGRLTIAESLGLDFYTDETKQEFKNIIDIFGEMSEKMQELKNEGKENSVEMQNLLSIFTVFRRNIGSSLLGEMAGEDSTYAEVLKTVQDSIGYSLQENEKHMKTAKAAQAQFNTTLLQLKTDVWDNGLEDTYKGMLMFGQDITTGISQLIKRFGLLPPIVATVTAAFGTFGKKLTIDTFKKYSAQIKDTSAAIELFNETVGSGQLSVKEFNEQMGQDVSNNFKKYTLSVKGGEASLVGFIAKTALAKAGQLALNVAIAAGEAAISFGITLAIQALVSVIQSWINAQSEAAKSIEEMNSKLDEDNQSLQEYADKYKQLSEELQNGSLTQEEIAKKKQELIEIEQQLVDQFGEEAKTIDLVNGKYDEQIKKINQLAQANFKKYQQENQKEINKLADTFEKVDKKQITFYSNGGKFSDQLKDKFKEAGNSIEAESSRIFNAGQIDVKFSGTIDEIIDKYRQFFDKIKEYRDNASGVDENYADLFLEQISNKISELEDKYSEDYETYKTYLENKLKYDEKYSSEYQKIEEARAKVSEAVSNGDLENLEKAKENLENIYKEAIENATNDKDVSKGMVKILQEQLDEANEYIEKEEIGFKIGIQEEETYDKIQEILNQMGDISSEDLEIMIDTGESTESLEALKEILDENGISTEEFIENFENLGFTLGNVGEKVNDITLPSLDSLQQSVQNSTQQLADLENSFVSVYNAMNEFNETGYMSASTLQNLIDNNLLQYFDVINGKLAVNEAAMANAATAAKVKTAQDLALKAAGEILKIVEDDVTNSVKNTKTQTNNTISPVNRLAEAMLKAGQDGSVAAIGLKEFWAAMQNENIDVSGLSAAAKASINNVLGSFQKSIKALNNVKITATAYTRVYSKGSGSGGSSKSSSSSSAQKEAEKAAEEAKKAEEDEYKRKLELWKQFVEDREDLETRWVKKQKELGQLSSKDFLYVTQQRIVRYQSYLDQIKKMTWLNEEDRLKLEKEYTEEIEDLQLDYFDYLKDILDDEIKALEDARDEQIDKIKEQNEETINLIKEEAQARIDALKKVEDENDRIRSKEEYYRKRQEHLTDISYWEQRTGREAQEALAEARKNLEELDREWQEQQEDWSIEDQIKAIEDQRDAQIEAIEQAEEEQIKAIEKETQKQIDELQRVYDERVKLFSESNQIIYDDTVIQSEALYKAYKENFVDPLKRDLEEIAKQTAEKKTTTSTNNTTSTKQSSSNSQQKYTTYKVKRGDTLSEIAQKYNTTVSKIMAANPSIKNKNLIYTGQTLKIPKFHTGGIFGGVDEGLAVLKRGEVVYKKEWADNIDRLAKMVKNSQTQTFAPSTQIEVKGDLVKIEADIQNKTDAEFLTKKIERMLTDKFKIKK